MKTESISKEEAIKNRRWYVVDAENQILGRLASELAVILMGKHRPTYTPHTDTGDFIIIINADKIRLTGKKEDKKRYIRHTGWVGGIVDQSAAQLRARKPEEMIRLAVHGMLPKGNLGRAMRKKLKIYANSEHPHVAQQPETLVFNGRK